MVYAASLLVPATSVVRSCSVSDQPERQRRKLYVILASDI